MCKVSVVLALSVSLLILVLMKWTDRREYCYLRIISCKEKPTSLFYGLKSLRSYSCNKLVIYELASEPVLWVFPLMRYKLIATSRDLGSRCVIFLRLVHIVWVGFYFNACPNVDNRSLLCCVAHIPGDNHWILVSESILQESGLPVWDELRLSPRKLLRSRTPYTTKIINWFQYIFFIHEFIKFIFM